MSTVRREVAVPGDVGSAAAVYFEYGATVFSVARRICGAALAEEVTQDVFLHLWCHPERFDPSRGTMRTFLTVRARGLAIDAQRSEHARSRREERTSGNPTFRASSVEDEVAEKETTTEMAAALALLPDNEREAIIVAYYGHHSYQETAAILGQPEGTTKARIRAGLKHLQPVVSPRRLPGQSALFVTLAARPTRGPPLRPAEHVTTHRSPLATAGVED